MQDLQSESFPHHILQHTATHCSTLQHTATHCHTLQHTATHCNMGRTYRVLLILHVATATHCAALLQLTLERTATHCKTLQHITTQCNTLQHTPEHTPGAAACADGTALAERLCFNSHCNTLQHTAARCNTLQHTATHCNTLYHIETH